MGRSGLHGQKQSPRADADSTGRCRLQGQMQTPRAEADSRGGSRLQGREQTPRADADYTGRCRLHGQMQCPRAEQAQADSTGGSRLHGQKEAGRGRLNGQEDSARAGGFGLSAEREGIGMTVFSKAGWQYSPNAPRADAGSTGGCRLHGRMQAKSKELSSLVL